MEGGGWETREEEKQETSRRGRELKQGMVAQTERFASTEKEHGGVIRRWK